MRTLRKIGFAIMVVMVCLFDTSCSDDDENNEGSGSGKISATIDGKSLGLTNVYWSIDTESSTENPGDKTMHIEFFNYNVTGGMSAVPKKMSFLSIDYEIPSNVTGVESITLQSDDYHLYVVQDLPTDEGEGGWQAETYYKDQSNSVCKITRDGDNYTITIENATVSDDYTEKNIQLYYSGSIIKMPDGYVE